MKFIGIDWDKDLFFVAFRDGDTVQRWYPKWEDLRHIILGAIETESHIAKERPRDWQQGPELDKFKTHFQEMIDMIDFSRSQ